MTQPRMYKGWCFANYVRHIFTIDKRIFINDKYSGIRITITL